ncbi:MAG: hypothetical protein J5584_04005 [Clostridia bacterium]|nr:hypothetical protein [Clostridia bacterium]
MKFYGRLLALLMVVICLSVLAILPASAKTSVTEHGTSEFFGGFTSRGDSRWTIKDGALVNGASGKAGRSVMAFDAQIDGTKSFKYEIVYSYSGYGVGLTFKTVDEDGYYAVETNGDQPNGKIYSLKRTPDWAIWQLSHVEIAEKTDTYDLVFEWNADTRAAEISLNGTKYNTAENYDATEIAGYVGVFTEDAAITVTKAELTVAGSKTDLLGAITLPANGSGEWTIIQDGLMNYRSGDGDRAVAVFGLEIDGTKSFKYEAEYTYAGYGVGPTFKTVDANGYYGLETNVDNYVYSMKRTPDWAIWQLNHTTIEPSADNYKLSFEWDAATQKAVIALNGKVYNTAEGYDATEIAGKLGFFTEGGAVATVRSLLLTVTEELPDDPTDPPQATTGPVDTTDEPAPATADPGVPSTGDINLLPLLIVVVICAAAACLLLLRKKENKI